MSKPGIAARPQPHLRRRTELDHQIARYDYTNRICKAFKDGMAGKECRGNGGRFISTGNHHRYCTGCSRILGNMG